MNSMLKQFLSLLITLLMLCLPSFCDPNDIRSWKDQHPQSRAQMLYTNVHDPAPPLEAAYKLSCYSCMSPYLEDQFMYISHLYRRPHAFTEKCDFNNFDGKYMRTRNCTDLCVSLRMNDKVGGRRRFGYMRGCMSDIIHYNRSIIRDYPGCYSVRLRDLFVSSDRYAFEPHDQVELCPCNKPYCNSAPSTFSSSPPPFYLIAFTSLLLIIFSKINNSNNSSSLFPKTITYQQNFYYSSPAPSSLKSLPSSSSSNSKSSKKKNNFINNKLDSDSRRISQKLVLEIGVS